MRWKKVTSIIRRWLAYRRPPEKVSKASLWIGFYGFAILTFWQTMIAEEGASMLFDIPDKLMSEAYSNPLFWLVFSLLCAHAGLAAFWAYMLAQVGVELSKRKDQRS